MVFVTFRGADFIRNLLPISSRQLALARQVVGRDDLYRCGPHRLGGQRAALLQYQPHRQPGVGAQIVVQHREAAFAQQPAVVGVEVVRDKNPADSS